ncbi:hypothetical protein BASA81_007279 [Batrachochytrium salamandrivorans]|nr:hypothetical protein BASA81_007279 [Batrachochytrium salamandrivorans]
MCSGVRAWGNTPPPSTVFHPLEMCNQINLDLGSYPCTTMACLTEDWMRWPYYVSARKECIQRCQLSFGVSCQYGDVFSKGKSGLMLGLSCQCSGLSSNSVCKRKQGTLRSLLPNGKFATRAVAEKQCRMYCANSPAKTIDSDQVHCDSYTLVQDPNSSPDVFRSARPSKSPTLKPTKRPTTPLPSKRPTLAPTKRPTTLHPSKSPITTRPSKSPTTRPTKRPTTLRPSKRPTLAPTKRPTTLMPSKRPTLAPTKRPTTLTPSKRPTTAPVESGGARRQLRLFEDDVHMARLTGGKEDIDFDAGLPEDDDVNDEDEGQLEEEYEGQVEEDSTVDASEEEMDDDAAADVEEEYESGGALAVVDGLDVQQRAVTAAPDFSGLYCTCGSSIGS